MSTLLYHATALLMDKEGSVLENAYVAVEGPSITYVGLERPQGNFQEEIDCNGNYLMPGLVNAHTHLPMTLLRGYGGGCDLQTWLNQYIFPAEAKLDARAIRAGAGLALAELIAGGTTCVADMYYFCQEITEEVAAAGISANIARGVTVFDPDFNFQSNAPCRELRDLADAWHGYGEGQILVDACLHGEYTSHPAVWQAVAAYAKERGLGMHVHLSETRTEHEECIQRHGKTPAQAFLEAGVWDVRAIAAHCVWTTPEDWAILAEHGVTAVHNPASNLKLGSGIANIPAMRQAGVPIALGTDGVSSNNSHDMFEEIKLAAILHNGAGCDPLAILPLDALAMATREGGAALGRKTGVIAPGYAADLIVLDANHPNLVPCHSLPDNLAYSAHGSDVVMNMARGKVIYKEGEYLTLDRERILFEVKNYALPRLFA